VKRGHAASVAGFTLVEALIATALMGAILTGITTITAQWLPNWNRGFARVQRSESIALALDRIVGDIEAAEFIPIGRDPSQLFFDGKELSMILVRSSFGPNTRNGLDQVRISEVASDQGPTLVRARGRYVPVVLGVNDRDPLRFPDQVVLLRAPLRASFAYAGSDRKWGDKWTVTDKLPHAVRVTLRDGGGQILGTSTATMVHAEMSSECTINPGGCVTAQPAPTPPNGPPTTSDDRPPRAGLRR
jgi:general secretion pathway protein J